MVPPVGTLQHKCPVAHIQGRRIIIVRVHDEEIACRLIPPLQPCIQIDVLLLVIVLHEGRDEELVGERYIHARTNEPKVGYAPGLREIDMVETGAHADIDIGLEPVAQVERKIEP